MCSAMSPGRSCSICQVRRDRRKRPTAERAPSPSAVPSRWSATTPGSNATAARRSCSFSSNRHGSPISAATRRLRRSACSRSSISASMARAPRRWSRIARRTRRAVRRRHRLELRDTEPSPAVGGELVEPVIVDAQQPALLEVRLRHPPGAAEVLQRQIVEQVDHRRPRPLEARPAVDRGLHPGGRRQRKRVEQGRPQTVEGEAAVRGQGPHQGAPELDHQHEVVEVPGLEGRVLAVVGEAQELADLAVDPGLAQPVDGGAGEDGGRRRAAGLRERHQLAEVALLPQLVARPAARADHQRPWLPPCLDRPADGYAAIVPSGGHPHSLGHVGPVVGLHPRPGLAPLVPAVGQVLVLGPEIAGLQRHVAGRAGDLLLGCVQLGRARQQPARAGPSAERAAR